MIATLPKIYRRNTNAIKALWAISIIMGVLVFSSCSSKKAQEKQAKPNILFIAVDDLRPELNCFGASQIKSPNLDQLAAKSLVFNRAYCNVPTCGASRASLLSGARPTRHRFISYDTRKDEQVPGVTSLPMQFKNNGYMTISNGKVFHHANDDSLAWHEIWRPKGDGLDYQLEKNFKLVNDGKRGLAFESANVDDEAYFDGKIANKGIADLNKLKDSKQPFFAQITLAITHRMMRPFRRDKMNPINPDSVFLPPYYPDTPVARRDWCDYLELIQVMDRQVGEIIARLKNEKLLDNTVIFFIGDNGRNHVRGKEFLYDGGISIPLIVYWNDKLEAGEIINNLVSSIDISAEILRIAGVEVPEYMEGRPFLFNQEGRQFVVAARDRSGTTFDRVRCIRTKEFKYIRNFYPHLPYFSIANNYKREQYPVQTLMQVMHANGTLTKEQDLFMAPAKPKEELYDLKNDSFELSNLVDDPEYENVLELQRNRLNTWVEETGDLGQIVEDPSIAAKFHEKYYNAFVKLMNKRGLDPQCNPTEYLKWWEEELF